MRLYGCDEQSRRCDSSRFIAIRRDSSCFLRSVTVCPDELFLRCFRFKYSILDRNFFSEKVFGFVFALFFFFIFVFFFVLVFFCGFVFFLVFFFIFIFGFSFITDNISLSFKQTIFFFFTSSYKINFIT